MPANEYVATHFHAEPWVILGITSAAEPALAQRAGKQLAAELRTHPRLAERVAWAMANFATAQRGAHRERVTPLTAPPRRTTPVTLGAPAAAGARDARRARRAAREDRLRPRAVARRHDAHRAADVETLRSVRDHRRRGEPGTRRGHRLEGAAGALLDRVLDRLELAGVLARADGARLHARCADPHPLEQRRRDHDPGAGARAVSGAGERQPAEPRPRHGGPAAAGARVDRAGEQRARPRRRSNRRHGCIAATAAAARSTRRCDWRRTCRCASSFASTGSRSSSELPRRSRRGGRCGRPGASSCGGTSHEIEIPAQMVVPPPVAGGRKAEGRGR